MILQKRSLDSSKRGGIYNDQSNDKIQGKRKFAQVTQIKGWPKNDVKAVEKEGVEGNQFIIDKSSIKSRV